MSKGTSSSSSSVAATATSTEDINGNGSDRRWNLTPYEEDRAPQEVITDHDTRMALHPECLRNDFMCPICLKLQTNTVTVMGCLHRFCRECINKAITNSSRECPVCRSKLPNKRYLRADPNFDMLISRLFPLREEDADDLPSSRSTRQSSRRLRTRYARDASPDSSLLDVDEATNGSSPSSLSPGQSNGLICQRALDPVVDDDVEVVLEPLSPSHNNAKDWLSQKRYIKTSPSATVDHMIKYLSTRYRMEVMSSSSSASSTRNQLHQSVESEVDESLFTLCVPNGPGQFQPVQPQETLGQIKDHWEAAASKNKDKPLVLHYAYDIGVQDEGSSDLMDALPPGPPPPSVHNNNNNHGTNCNPRSK